MAYNTAAIYSAALQAIEESFEESELKQQVLKFAAQCVGASSAGLESLSGIATSCDQKQQGDLLWKLNKSIENPQLRRRIADALARKLAPLAGAPERDASESAKSFQHDGIAVCPALVTPAEAAEMMSYLQRTETVRLGSTDHHHIRDVVGMPHAFRIATDERVLALAQHQLGIAPTVMQLDVRRSPVSGEKPHDVQIYHRDRDDFAACKLFVYLTDVGPQDGPHVFVRGSHREEAIASALQVKGITPAQTGTLFAGNGRQFDGVINDVFGPSVMEITGPAGTSFLENTYAFHRGKVPLGRERYVFQVLYALIPYPDRLKRWADAGMTSYPEGIAHTPHIRQALRLAVN